MTRVALYARYSSDNQRGRRSKISSASAGSRLRASVGRWREVTMMLPSPAQA